MPTQSSVVTLARDIISFTSQIRSLRQQALDLMVEAQHNNWFEVDSETAQKWAQLMSKAADSLGKARVITRVSDEPLSFDEED